MRSDWPQVEMTNGDRKSLLGCCCKPLGQFNLFGIIIDVRMEIADGELGHIGFIASPRATPISPSNAPLRRYKRRFSRIGIRACWGVAKW